MDSSHALVRGQWYARVSLILHRVYTIASISQEMIHDVS